MLSEISQEKEYKCCLILFMFGIIKSIFHRSGEYNNCKALERVVVKEEWE